MGWFGKEKRRVDPYADKICTVEVRFNDGTSLTKVFQGGYDWVPAHDIWLSPEDRAREWIANSFRARLIWRDQTTALPTHNVTAVYVHDSTNPSVDRPATPV